MSLYRELFLTKNRLVIKPGIIFLLLLFIYACSDKKNDPEPETTGHIKFNFIHLVNNNTANFDTLKYTNEAGNPYLINEIQYFLSDVILYKNGIGKLIHEWKDCHYVDTDIPSSFEWQVYDKMNEGIYDSIVFTFGFSDEKNKSFMFVNPPERDMFWPEYLGGGYHYMKLNGKWLEEGQTVQTTPFDFHLGRGQIYYSYPDSITGFISNEFSVSLANSGFTVRAGEITEITIAMNIEKWFKEPYVYNHDIYGGYIMQNQEAMNTVKKNGYNVFSIYQKD